MNFNQLSALVKMAKTPGIFSVLKDWNSCVRFHFIHSALECGLLAALEHPRTFEELLQELDVENAELLQALLDVGASAGELSFRRGVYELKGKISRSVVTEKGEPLGALIQANVTYYNSAYRHLSARMRGADLSDDLGEIGELVARVSKMQEPFIKNFIAEAVRGRDRINLLEIGCGSGTFMKTAYDANRNAAGIGIDCDENVVRQAEDNIRSWGLSDRFEIVLGDARTSEVMNRGPFDLITLYNILYYFEPAERVELVKKLKMNLAPGGRLAVVATTQSNGKDLMAANLNLVNCSLRGVTSVPELDSLQRLFMDSGFQTVKIDAFMPGSTVYSMLVE